MKLTLEVGGAVYEFTERGGPYPWLIASSGLFAQARAGHLAGFGDGKAPSAQASLDNDRGQAYDLVGRPLRCRATLTDDDGTEVLAGVVQSVRVGEASLDLTVDSMLWERLPLRTTAQLGDYAVKTPLPYVVGDLRSAPFPLIRLSPTLYFAADHPIVVAGVQAEGAAVAGWQAELASDVDGRTWTVVRFAEAQPHDAAISATAIGYLDPESGGLIENPADVFALISRLAGRDDDWSQFRAICSRAGITIAGRFASAPEVQDMLDTVAQAIGASWIPGAAILYPSLADPTEIIDLRADEIEDITVEAAVDDDSADRLRLYYDVSDARGKPQRYIELRARPVLYGGRAVERTSAWLRESQAAEAVGRALLSRIAGERWAVTFTLTSQRRLMPLQSVRLVAHPEWPLGADPRLMVLVIQQQGAGLFVTAEYLATRPDIEVVGFSVALPDAVAAALSVDYADGIATITLTGEGDGAPVGGALIAVDGGIPQTTNMQGQARFQLSRGQHVVAASGHGFAPFEITIEI